MSWAESRIRALPLWNGAISIEPLKGGLSNESFLVEDANGKHVVRFGKDFPFHHVFRDREVMVARAAACGRLRAARSSSQNRASWSRHFSAQRPTARTTCAANRARDRQADAQFPYGNAEAMSRGAGFMFWVFHVIRDYARTLEAGKSRMVERAAGAFWR